MNQIAIVVHTCDRYRLLYTGFEYFFKKYWPVNELKLNAYFLTEEVDYPSDMFTNIKTGKGEWSDRLLMGLKQIPEKHIVYFQEDMWLTKPADYHTLETLFDFVQAEQINLVKLSSNAVYHTNPTGAMLNGLSVSVLDNVKSAYLMSHQVSVWDKAFLMEQLKYKEHPWRNERKGTVRLRKLNPVIYQVDLFSENGNAPNNKNYNNAAISQYYTVSQNAMLNIYAAKFIDEMNADNNPQIKAYAEVLAHNFQNAITHDGKSKPRKDDIFKKIKNFFMRK